MLKIKNPRFEKSIVNLKDRPGQRLPEFAFVGRSNVGKSSLINCLVNIRNFAKVSKTPGKTRTINYFNIDDLLYLVDLPGYGFANVPLSEKAKWQQTIENYLLNSEDLRLLFALVDSKVGLKDTDVQLIEWLRFSQIPFRIVATKADKISKTAQLKQETAIRQILHINDEIIFFSAKNRTGRDDILKILSGYPTVQKKNK